MTEAGFSMKRLSQRAGLGESYVRDILNRDREPSVENLQKIADLLNVSVAWIVNGEDGVMHVKIPVVGYASAGEGWTPFDESNVGETIAFELNGPDYIGIQVRGDSMSPVFRDGDHLLCRRTTSPNVDNFIGLECVLRTTAGENYVKILARGSRPGRFNLRSYNPLFRDIEDVKIEWIAPILWVKRRGI